MRVNVTRKCRPKVRSQLFKHCKLLFKWGIRNRITNIELFPAVCLYNYAMTTSICPYILAEMAGNPRIAGRFASQLSEL